MEEKEIKCTFVGDFKVGDNLRFNCQVLCALVDRNHDGVLRKMIVVQVGSIIEAALTQIIYRAQNYNREGVPNIDESDRLQIEQKKIDKFAVAIDVLNKYKVFDGLGENIAEELHTLRKYRNKVHIQDVFNVDGGSRDERTMFGSDLTAWALRLNRDMLTHLSEKYARPPHVQEFLGALRVP